MRPNDDDTSGVMASTTNINFVASEDEEDRKGPEEKKVLEGREVIKQMEKYYTYGIDEIFSILVTSIFSPPSKLCYRMLNYDHVAEIVESMIRNLGHELAVADLIPYNVDKKTVLTCTNTLEDRRLFQIAAKIGKIQFVAISGQHSAAAAKQILDWAAVNTNINDIAAKLTYRKSRILSASTPMSVLVEHSFRSNAINETMKFKSTFLDIVVHARRQWLKCGSPSRPL